jgi:manganese transport protein
VLRFAGPGLLVSVGYMDPGNWATAIQGGSQFGYQLLFVVVLSSLAAIVLQCLSMRLGIVTGKDLAVHCREQYSPAASKTLWGFAEISIIACDLAEVLGCALAFKLLLGVSLPVGVALTALDTLIVLGLKGKGFRQIEAIVLGLILTVAICLFTELVLINPDWHAVMAGMVPSLSALSEREPLYLAIGILGATVMPHNLYLHSSVVQTRVVSNTESAASAKRSACRASTPSSRCCWPAHQRRHPGAGRGRVSTSRATRACSTSTMPTGCWNRWPARRWRPSCSAWRC